MPRASKVVLDILMEELKIEMKPNPSWIYPSHALRCHAPMHRTTKRWWFLGHEGVCPTQVCIVIGLLHFSSMLRQWFPIGPSTMSWVESTCPKSRWKHAHVCSQVEKQADLQVALLNFIFFCAHNVGVPARFILFRLIESLCLLSLAHRSDNCTVERLRITANCIFQRENSGLSTGRWLTFAAVKRRAPLRQ